MRQWPPAGHTNHTEETNVQQRVPAHTHACRYQEVIWAFAAPVQWYHRPQTAARLPGTCSASPVGLLTT